MINRLLKRIIILTIVVLIGFESNGQSKFGTDSMACIENRSLYYQSYQQKNYADALGPWSWAFRNCPRSAENIFKNGPKIINARIKIDPQNKAAYTDTLMMIYDQRIKYFGKEGYVLGLKGNELMNIDKSRSEEALSYFQQSLDIDASNSSVYAVYGYMKAIVNLEKKGEKTKQDVLEAYARISEIVDYNIVNATKTAKNFIQYSEKIENLFTPYANCEDLIELFSKKFNPSMEDINALKRFTDVLDKNKCTDSDLFFDASSRLYELEPSASAANKMAKMSTSKRKSTAALEFAKKAVELEEDANKKAIYYLGLADAYRNKGSYSSARNAVYSALELRKGWGKAYMNLGYIYIAGAKACGDDFEKITVYWVAVDAFKNAKGDKDTRRGADTAINTYEKYFPSSKSLWMDHGITVGSKYRVGCWVNKTTTARTPK